MLLTVSAGHRRSIGEWLGSLEEYLRSIGEWLGSLEECLRSLEECLRSLGECLGSFGEWLWSFGECLGSVGECLGSFGECLRSFSISVWTFWLSVSSPEGSKTDCSSPAARNGDLCGSGRGPVVLVTGVRRCVGRTEGNRLPSRCFAVRADGDDRERFSVGGERDHAAERRRRTGHGRDQDGL